MKKNTTGYFAIIILLSVTSVFSLNQFFQQRTERDILHIRTFPHEIDGWRGRDFEISEREYEILETRNLISREYTDNEGRRIHLFIIYSETNRSVFHPPEVCFIGSGLTILDRQRDRLDYKTRRVGLNKLCLKKGDMREVVLYCYKSGTFYTDNYYLQQVSFALKQLIGRRNSGATIRLSMRTGAGKEEAALVALKRFMQNVITEMEVF